MGFPVPEPDRKSVAARVRAHRQRQADAGLQPVVLDLPRSVIARLDALKEHRGLRNRSQAVLELIEQSEETAQ